VTTPSGDVRPPETEPGPTGDGALDPGSRESDRRYPEPGEAENREAGDTGTRQAGSRESGARQAGFRASRSVERDDANRVSNAGAVRRPPEMVLGAAFLTAAALPSIMVGGVLAALVGRLGATLRDRIIGAAGTMDPDSLVLAARVAGAVALLAGVAFIALAWLAVRPKRWARPIVAALAAAEMALLVVGMVATAPDPVSIGLTLLAGAGVALLYLSRSEEFLLSQG
jgi:hypothetical protein